MIPLENETVRRSKNVKKYKPLEEEEEEEGEGEEEEEEEEEEENL